MAEPLARQLRAKRSEMMTSALEAVALRLFDERGFDEVTIEEIATEANISVRTFYRYFSAKDDVLQVEIDRRSEGIRTALSARPNDEPALQSLRLAFGEVISREDSELLRRWIAVIQATPSVVKGVLGGIQLKTQRVIREFFAARLGLQADGLVPVILAAAVGGVVQAALTRWFYDGGDVTTTVSESLEVLERGFGTDLSTWSASVAESASPGWSRPVDRGGPGRPGLADPGAQGHTRRGTSRSPRRGGSSA